MGLQKILLRRKSKLAVFLSGIFLFNVVLCLFVVRVRLIRSDWLEEVEPLPSEDNEEAQDDLFNIPPRYLDETRGFAYRGSCLKYPGLFDLHFDNVFWQKFVTSNGTFYLLGAYYDDRPLAQVPAVRLLAMVDKTAPPALTCLLWSGTRLQQETNASYILIWHRKWGNFKDGNLLPYLISCNVTEQDEDQTVPTSVSLVEEFCDLPTTNLKVVHVKPKVKERFAVCVKGLNFYDKDMSVRLVEWMELLSILGAHRVFLYELSVHANMSKVLQYYQSTGFAQVTPMTLPGSQPNLPLVRFMFQNVKKNDKRINEVIPYNDCLYRNLNSYDYVVLLDIDEIVMPLRHDNWDDMLREVEKEVHSGTKTYTSFSVGNIYFLDHFEENEGNDVHQSSVPAYMHMLQHVRRSVNFTDRGMYEKSFQRVDRVLGVHNHYPRVCLKSCRNYPINTSIAQLQHYREDCVKELRKRCKSEYQGKGVEDTSIWRFKEELIRRSTRVLRTLKLV